MFELATIYPRSNQIKNGFKKLGYPSDILEYIINSFKKNINTKPLDQYGPTKRKVFLKLPYLDHLSKRIKMELDHLIINYFPNVSFQTIFCNNNRIRNLCNKAIKSKLSKCFISHVVYQVNCIDCNGSYLGKLNKLNRSA